MKVILLLCHYILITLMWGRGYTQEIANYVFEGSIEIYDTNNIPQDALFFVF